MCKLSELGEVPIESIAKVIMDNNKDGFHIELEEGDKISFFTSSNRVHTVKEKIIIACVNIKVASGGRMIPHKQMTKILDDKIGNGNIVSLLKEKCNQDIAFIVNYVGQ